MQTQVGLLFLDEPLHPPNRWVICRLILFFRIKNQTDKGHTMRRKWFLALFNKIIIDKGRISLEVSILILTFKYF